MVNDLSTQDFNDLVRLLANLPHFDDRQSRMASWVRPAFLGRPGGDVVMANIPVAGDTNAVVASEMIDYLARRYGQVEPGIESLGVFLDHLAANVGPEGAATARCMIERYHMLGRAAQHGERAADPPIVRAHYLDDADAAFAPVERDAAIIEVASTDPPDGATGVPRNLCVVRIKFNRPIAGTISYKSHPRFTKGQAVVKVDGDTCTVTRRNPYRLLPASAVFEFTVNPPDDGPEDGFRDLNGNRARTYKFAFTTGATPDPTHLVAGVDRVALRKAMVKRFAPPESLDAVCQDVEQFLLEDGVELQVNIDLVGGRTLTIRALHLIQYLDCRGYLPYLLAALYEEAPEIHW